MLNGKASKYDSLFMKIEITDDQKTSNSVKRVIYVPWAIHEKTYYSKLGRFYFNGKAQNIHIYLPQGVILKKLNIAKYTAPAVPIEAENYQPTIVPPASRPRILVNSSTLQKVKDNLKIGKNKDSWNIVKDIAIKPYTFPYENKYRITKPDSEVEKTMEYKAFYYLIDKDKKIGRESIEIAKKYIKALDFGNILDMTRPTGNAIFRASEVYDWCYDLLTENEKKFFIEHFKYLAESMEIGWPPFVQNITYGHGSEEQLSKYLFAMSIAIYDEDPIPYKYTSYRILKELSPMRKFQYQSPRHNQGMSYGPYRYRADIMAALLFKKMSNKEVFDENIKNVYLSFIYNRLTNKQFFNDRDGYSQYYGTNIYYAETSLIHSAYAKGYKYKNIDIAKLSKGNMAILNKYRVFNGDRILSLLLNDPTLKPISPDKDGLSKLPLTLFTGKVVGSMIARTGWDMSDSTNDVVVDMKGGGYNFNNHQHDDAGSFQIFYKGKQIVDLGQYHFYGTPYDYNFNKRSIAHSMMLVVDPNEKDVHDGGTKAIYGNPTSKAMTLDKKYHLGETISQSIEPSNILNPDFSYYAVDLTDAYSEKVTKYQRKSIFLNLKNDDTPAVLIVLDTINTANANFKKYWQINTLNRPNINANGVITIHNSIKKGDEGNVVVNILQPSLDNRTIKLWSGAKSTNVFGTQYTPPFPDKPEAKGTRIMVSPNSPNEKDTFLTTFTMKKPNADNLNISYKKSLDNKTYHISIDNNILVIMNSLESLLDNDISINIVNDNTKLFVSGLKSGTWILSKNGVKLKTFKVIKGKNTAFFKSLKSDNYILEKVK